MTGKNGGRRGIKFIQDRSSKVKTRSEFEPNNRFGSFEASLKTFKTLRKERVQFVKKTQEDLRNHYFEFPFGLTDAYQVIIFMACHHRRHLAQIKEAMAEDGFPVK